MIKREKDYLDWLELVGVGSNDKVASSRKSYVSYLNSVSKLIGEDISEKNLYDDACIERITEQIRGKRSKRTIDNYRSAMKQYVRMIQLGFRRSS